MKKLIFLILFFGLCSLSIVHAQDTQPIPIPPIPDCETITVQPDVLIGGNIMISLGGLDIYQSYVNQTKDSHLLTIEGDQMLGDKLTLEGCFVDESSFVLFGTKGKMDVLFVGVAIEPEFSAPTFGGLWYGWSHGYDANEPPDEKGYFFQLF
jgi:hypothetical protein